MSQKMLEKIENLSDKIVEQVKKLGADDCAVNIRECVGHSLVLRNFEVEELSREKDLSIALTVYKNHKSGQVSFSDFSDEAIKMAAESALNGLQFTEEDFCLGLPEPDLYYKNNKEVDLGQWHMPIVSIQRLSELALACEKAALDYDSRVTQSDAVNAYAIENYNWLKLSNGFSQGKKNTQVGMSVSVLAKENGVQQSNYAYDGRFCLEDLLSPQEIGRKAAKKTVDSLNPKEIKTGDYPVIFSNEVSAGLIGHFLQAISGINQYRKLSFLTDSIGKEVFPEWLTLEEQPTLYKGASSQLFDREGIIVSQPIIVKNGVVERYILDHYAAQKLDMPVTGNASGVHNLKLVADQSYQFEFGTLLEKMGTGILVTSLMGQGVNMLTGDYSRGASGFWVENGKIQYAIEGITIAGHLNKMLAGILAIGRDIDDHGKVHAPSILIDNMTIAK